MDGHDHCWWHGCDDGECNACFAHVYDDGSYDYECAMTAVYYGCEDEDDSCYWCTHDGYCGGYGCDEEMCYSCYGLYDWETGAYAYHCYDDETNDIVAYGAAGCDDDYYSCWAYDCWGDDEDEGYDAECYGYYWEWDCDYGTYYDDNGGATDYGFCGGSYCFADYSNEYDYECYSAEYGWWYGDYGDGYYAYHCSDDYGCYGYYSNYDCDTDYESYYTCDGTWCGYSPEYEACYASGHGYSDEYGSYSYWCDSNMDNEFGHDCYGYYFDGDCNYYDDTYYCYGDMCHGTFASEDYYDADYACVYGVYGYDLDDGYFGFFWSDEHTHGYGYACDWYGDCMGYYMDIDWVEGENGAYAGSGLYCYGAFNYYDEETWGADYSCETFYGSYEPGDPHGYYTEAHCDVDGWCSY